MMMINVVEHDVGHDFTMENDQDGKYADGLDEIQPGRLSP